MEEAIRHRNTRQGRIVLEELRKVTSHPTAPELCRMVRRRLPGISLSTVYRNLARLEAAGTILRLDGGKGESRYDGNPVEHVHIFCPACGCLFDAPDPPEGFLNDYRQRLEGYEILGSRLEFTAICPECLESGHREDP